MAPNRQEPREPASPLVAQECFAFSKAVEKEATFRRKEKERLTPEIVLMERARG